MNIENTVELYLNDIKNSGSPILSDDIIKDYIRTIILNKWLGEL